MERVTAEGGLWGEVREALRRGALVLTGNERAARTLRRRYDEGLRAGGGERWEPARVMSWTAWTSSLWRRMLLEGRAKALPLNGFQEHAVWRGVVAADRDRSGEGWGQRGVDGLAEMAAESWARMCAYGEAGPARRGARTLGFAGMLPGGGDGFAPSGLSGSLFSGGLFSDGGADGGGSRDTEAFARWARAFEERCGAEQFLTAAELEAALWRAMGAGAVAADAAEVLLVGFDRMTPAAERLLGRLRASGVLVARAGPGRIAGRRVLMSAADEGEELRACARWAAAWMGREPAARLAVILPDVAGERAGVERVFREVLAPELELIGSDAGAPYEFSLGRALAEVPMAAVAMELLRWAEGPLPLGRVSGLLVSDYVGASGRGEREARAEFDALELRRAGMLRPEMSYKEMVRRVAGSRRSTRLPGLLRALRGMGRVAEGFEGVSQSYGQWAAGMREVLLAAEWGAGGAETSEEFQVRERWEGALDALATLDFENQAVDYGEALGAMERIAAKTIFAPESRSAAVQVMGPMEAAGSEFDAVWLLRAGEGSWPPVVGAMPLLPWGLQRDLGMPGTDLEIDLAMARALTERIGRSGGREVVMSYARHGSEARQRASGVVRGMGLEEVEVGEVAGEEGPRAVVAMEWAEDVGRVRALPDAPVHGGVRVLELQAACGFRAFAEQRLWSSELEDRGLGLNAKESGTAVHAALECFWREVGTQAALLAMHEAQRDEAVLRAVDEGLRRARVGAAGAWDEAYLATQRERLRRLLGGWLEMEMARPAFTVEQSEERLQDVRVGPLRFQLRVDRVDVVDEMQVLIDYKTGAAGTKDWLGERPDAPQVPLYAILAARGGRTGAGEGDAGEPKADGGRGELGAVAFGRVKVGKDLGLRGFAAREGLLPGKPARMDVSTFEGQVERWEGVLTELAEEFAAGEARVRPKNYPSTCERCGQRVLCRLDASLLEEMDEDENGEDADG